jgi:threonine/homoserine/homoserine lactone efflux protein
MSPFVEGLLAGYGIAVPVGAVAILIVNTSIRSGFTIGFMAGAGAATADLLYAVLASVAGAALTAWLEPVASPLRMLGGLVLIGLASWGLWQGLKRGSRPEKTTEARAPLMTYAQFVGITIINPLTIVYFTAFILGRGPSAYQYPVVASLLFVLGVGLASLSWQTLLAALGGVAGTRLSNRFRRLAIILGNLLVLALGARILVTAIL